MECSLCTETCVLPGVTCPQCPQQVCLACELHLDPLLCPFCRTALPPASTRRWTSVAHFLAYCHAFQERERVRWDRFTYASRLFDRYTNGGAVTELRDVLWDEETDDELLRNLFFLARNHVYDIAYYDKDMDQIENILHMLHFLQQRQPCLLKFSPSFEELEELYWAAEEFETPLEWYPAAPVQRTPPRPNGTGYGAQWYTRVHRYQQC